MTSDHDRLAERLVERAVELSDPYRVPFHGRGWSVLFALTSFLDTRSQRVEDLARRAGSDTRALWTARGLVSQRSSIPFKEVHRVERLLEDAFFTARMRSKNDADPTV